jgi:hypothetical protein
MACMNVTAQQDSPSAKYIPRRKSIDCSLMLWSTIERGHPAYECLEDCGRKREACVH